MHRIIYISACIVEADGTARIHERLIHRQLNRIVPACQIIADRYHRIRILIFDPGNDLFGILRIVLCITAEIAQQFIADRIHDHRRIIARLLHHPPRYIFRPGLIAVCVLDSIVPSNRLQKEAAAIVDVSVLRINVGIKSFFNQQNALLCTKSTENPSRRMMRRTDRIDAHPFQLVQLPLHRRLIARCAKGAVILMQTDTLQLHSLPVEEKAMIRVPFCIAIAEGNRNRITAIRRRNSDLPRILRRIIYRPERQIPRLNGLRNGRGLLCLYNRLRRGFTNRRSSRITQHTVNSYLCIIVTVIAQNDRSFGFGTVLLFELIDIIADCSRILIDKHRIRHLQPHIPIDSAAGIPAAVGLGIFNTDSQHIFTRPVNNQAAAQIQRKRGIAIRMIAKLLPVKINLRPLIDTIKYHRDPFPLQ